MATFETEMNRARAMRIAEPDRAEFWNGYERGLRRAHHGESFGTEAEHTQWLSLADDQDEARRQRGEGYRAGLVMNSGRRGRPQQFAKTSAVTFRIEDTDLERMPEDRQNFVRAAIKEKLDRDEI